MSGLFGGSGGVDKSGVELARKREQTATEEEQRARQKAERSGTGRGRDLLVGRLNKVLPTNLGGVS